jgi:molybdopterin-containing oxidoreductase family membrane subunit
MPADPISILGLFETEDQTAAAILELHRSTWTLERVHTPFPSHKIMDALQLQKSKVGWFTLAGGIIGFFTGFLLAAFTAARWGLIVGGKPVVALVPFFIVGFEFTILFAIFGNVLGIISCARLPRFALQRRYDPRVSANRFGILATCPAPEQERLIAFFQQKGAEIRDFSLPTTSASSA